MDTRIYLINGPSSTHLVRAGTKAQAVRYVTRTTYQCAVASQQDIIDTITAGTPVEDATREEEQS